MLLVAALMLVLLRVGIVLLVGLLLRVIIEQAITMTVTVAVSGVGSGGLVVVVHGHWHRWCPGGGGACGLQWRQHRGVAGTTVLRELSSVRSFFDFMRRFWNQILICLSLRLRALAISMRRRRVMYLLKWNSFSSSRVW